MAWKRGGAFVLTGAPGASVQFAGTNAIRTASRGLVNWMELSEMPPLPRCRLRIRQRHKASLAAAVERAKDALEPPPEQILRVAVVHEDAVAGLQAAEVLQHIAARLEDHLGRGVSPWEICSNVMKFDWLAGEISREEVVAKSGEADLIVVAVSNCDDLPSPVKSWLETVLARKRLRAVALVALVAGGKLREPAPALVDYLSQIAAQNGADLFCNVAGQPGPWQESPPFLAWIRRLIIIGPAD
jgi:hypothetical protein